MKYGPSPARDRRTQAFGERKPSDLYKSLWVTAKSPSSRQHLGAHVQVFICWQNYKIWARIKALKMKPLL